MNLEWSQEIKLGINLVLNRVAHLKFGGENEDHYWPSFQRILSSSSTLFACLFFEKGIHNVCKVIEFIFLEMFDSRIDRALYRRNQ